MTLAVALAYANAWHGAFVFDDWPTILENPALRPWFRALEFWNWPPGNTASGRPLLALTLSLNYALTGLSLPAWHAVNLALHLATAFTLAGVVTRLLRRTHPTSPSGTVGWVAALLWAVHPLNTSSVTYLIQRAESLVSLCLLLTVWTFLRAQDEPARRRLWLTLSVIACAAGMASKEVMVVAPIVVFLVDGCAVASSWREPLRQRRGYYLALAATWLLLAVLVATAGRAGREAGFSTLSAWFYLKCQAGILWHYARLWVWPDPLVFDYFWSAPTRWIGWVPQGLALVALLWWSVRGVIRRQPAALAVLTMFLILAPSSSLLPLPSEVAAEHRFYLPGALLCGVATFGVVTWLPPRLLLIAVVCLTGVLGHATFRRNRDYASDLQLWADTLAKQPDSPRAALSLAQIHERRGDLSTALAFATRAQTSAPDDPQILHTLGRLLARNQRAEEALFYYERARQRMPRDPRLVIDQANALLLAGREDQALAACRSLSERDPRYVPALWLLAVIHAKRLETAEARQYAERVLALNPDDPDARRLLNALPPR